MRTMTGTIVVIASLSLLGCDRNPARNMADGNIGGVPAANHATPPQEAAASLPAQDFADALAASDAFEIESSRLAVAKATTPAIRTFARKMIGAHMASTSKLKKETAAMTPAIKPDPALSPEQQQKFDTLRSLAGAEFERTYVADQVAGHETALGVVQAYSESGDAPILKAFATQATRMVSDHLDAARKLAPGAAARTGS